MNRPKEFNMVNVPWECPRCKRMNAPFNPTCFCQPEAEKIKTEIIRGMTANVYPNYCPICNGQHGGGIGCATL